MDKIATKEPAFSIAAVEREVGVSKDVLRVWERRYGFPAPHRDSHGERLYPADQVRRLALVKRLMDRGLRAGRLLPATWKELQALASSLEQGRAASREPAPELDGFLRHLRAHDAQALADALQHRVAQDGLQRFVLDTVSPMTVLVGEAWAKGELQIHEEHLFTEVVTRVLRQSITQLPAGRAPVVLLTTLPDEPHAMGLLMAECLFTLHGARCINLGMQMPILEIVRAAQAHGVDIVALSLSSAFPARFASPLVRQVRAALPAAMQLWAGGAGAVHLSRISGVQVLVGLTEIAALLTERPQP